MTKRAHAGFRDEGVPPVCVELVLHAAVADVRRRIRLGVQLHRVTGEILASIELHRHLPA